MFPALPVRTPKRLSRLVKLTSVGTWDPATTPNAGYDIYAGMNLSKVITFSFDRGLEVLEGALAIGRQADPLGLPEVQSRMDAARAGQGRSAKAAASEVAQSKPFFAKAKSWLTTKEKEPGGAA